MKDLRDIFRRKFTQHYQPIVNMQTLELIRYEALLRPLGFTKDTETLVREMERAGTIRELDLWSIETAIKKISDNIDCVPIAINLSARSLCDPLFHSEVEWILTRMPVGNKISFEITESEPITDMSLARRFVKIAQGMGCCVGLDDFGTGNARFRVAQELKLDYLKLSARLTTMIETNSQARALIQKVVGMADEYGMGVVAEHIDNPKQYAWLRDTGIELGQGWLFAKAAPEVESKRNYFAEVKQAINQPSKQSDKRVVSLPKMI